MIFFKLQCKRLCLHSHPASHQTCPKINLFCKYLQFCKRKSMFSLHLELNIPLLSSHSHELTLYFLSTRMMSANMGSSWCDHSAIVFFPKHWKNPPPRILKANFDASSLMWLKPLLLGQIIFEYDCQRLVQAWKKQASCGW